MVSTTISSPFHTSPFHTAPQKKTKMSITQTYFLAHQARAKLSHEAGRPDHNLRLLVGHANLLDGLMVELADAEREQESWFNQSVRGASSPAPSKTEERHIQWADSIPEDDSESSSDESDMDYDDEEDMSMEDAAPLRRMPSSPRLPTVEVDEIDMMDEDEDEDYAELALTRSPSHSAQPPELDDDSDSSEDESMPPSPPTATFPTFAENEKKQQQQQQEAQQQQEDDKADFYEEGFYLPPRNPSRLVSAVSVY